MANINNIGSNPIDKILPHFGEPRVNTPIWNESQHMFITDQYTSAAGHTYYLGVRFSERFVTILHIGIYHNWTYINDVEVYAFDGKEKVLVGKTALDTYYNEELVRETTEHLLSGYIEGQLRLQGANVDKKLIDEQVTAIVDKSYISLAGADALKQLEIVKPLLLEKKNSL